MFFLEVTLVSGILVVLNYNFFVFIEGDSCIFAPFTYERCYVGMKKKEEFSPDVGLEPTTLRLRVSCSTD